MLRRVEQNELKTRIRTCRVAMEGYGQPSLLQKYCTCDCGCDDRFRPGSGCGQQVSAGLPRGVAILYVRLTSIRRWSRSYQGMFRRRHYGALSGDAQGHDRSRLRFNILDGYRHIQYLALRLELRVQKQCSTRAKHARAGLMALDSVAFACVDIS